MPTCSHPARPPQRPPTTSRRLRPLPRAVLPPSVRTQLAQQLARLLQRVRDGEAGHADRTE
jgi:hypothetical protein